MNRNPCLSLAAAKLSTHLKVSFPHFFLYPHLPLAASSEGSIPLEEQEELWLIETDQGDGWTR